MFIKLHPFRIIAILLVLIAMSGNVKVSGSYDIRMILTAITEYTIPTGESSPYAITPGLAGTIWFTELGSNRIGRITLSEPGRETILNGVSITEFPIPTSGSQPAYIILGPDNNLWFTEYSGDKIGKITPSGVITEFPLPTNSKPIGITVGSDGNLWFCEDDANKIGKMNSLGTLLDEYSLPFANGDLSEIVAGPDGNLWFTEYDGKKVGKITTGGTITEYNIGEKVFGIAVGSDGNLWFTETIADTVGRITPSGTITEFDLPGENNGPQGITSGPFNHLYVTANFSNKIFRLTILGETIAQYNIPTLASSPLGITSSNGNIWFVEMKSSQVGAFTPPGAWNYLPVIIREAFTFSSWHSNR